MKVIKFKVEPEAVKGNQQYGGVRISAGNACPCGCSPKPWVSISDGADGMTIQFGCKAEIAKFKKAVQALTMES
jgi:hypothetical protein